MSPAAGSQKTALDAWFSKLEGKKQANRETPLEGNGVNPPLELEVVVEVEEKLDQKC